MKRSTRKRVASDEIVDSENRASRQHEKKFSYARRPATTNSCESRARIPVRLSSVST
jgi:hypothetical protein